MMKKFIVLPCSFIFCMMCFSIQAKAHTICMEAAKVDSVYSVVDELPQFPGGEEALAAYLSKNLRYPAPMLSQKKAGGVFAEFIVNKKGKITDVAIKKTVDEGFNEEVVRVLKAMPKWKPAVQDGKKVSFRMTLPILFRLSR